MGVAVPLTVLLLGLPGPGAALPQATDASVLAAVASSCPGAITAAGDTHSRLEAMYCGTNVVRRGYGLSAGRRNGPLHRPSLLKGGAGRPRGFTRTPPGKS